MTDVFRQVYRKLTGEELDHVDAIKRKAGELHSLLGFRYTAAVDARGQREFALARTKLEECVMWATKAIT